MKADSIIVTHRPQQGLLLKAGILAVVCLFLSEAKSFAKAPSLTAIEIYDGPSGAASVQFSDVLINGKAELRDCTPYAAAAVDKGTYGKMQKVALAAGMILERDKNGVLHYGASGTTPICVVPDNVKFEHSASYSLSDLAEQARPTGTVLGGGTGAIPPTLPKGVKLVLLAAPDEELAEYLVAQRAGTVAGWRDYLAKNQASPHLGDSKRSLALLYVAAGQVSLDGYRRGIAGGSPDYKSLKSAKTQADQALAVVPGLDQAGGLVKGVQQELSMLTANGKAEIEAYQTALKTHTAGYAHLQAAKEVSEGVKSVDPNNLPGQALAADVTTAGNSFDSALREAESAVVEKQMDKAMSAVAPLVSFAPEVPRVRAVLDAAYGYFLQTGKQFADAADWQNAIKNFEKAAKVADTPEVHASLQAAQKQLAISQDKAAAAKALEQSKDYESQKDIINAFETLYFLPDSQKAMVGDDIERLKPAYVVSAAQEATNQQKAHSALAGLADEIGIEDAYTYLQRVYELTKQDSYKDTMDILAEDLSNYFVARAKLYLDKPSGSGTEMGWNYLDESLSYVRSNQVALDAKIAASGAHKMHSKISLRVRFRDQTSSRNSSGFIDTLEDTIVASLEESPTLKAVRANEQTANVEPDFQLDGEILEHEINPTPTATPIQSKYRAGTEPYQNEKWTAAKHNYDSANRDIETDRTELQAVETKGKKKEIQEWKEKLEQDTKKANESQAALDSTPQNLTRDVIRTYNYTQRTIDIKNTIKLRFRIGETLSDQKGEAEVVQKDEDKQFILIEDAKPEDTENVKNTGTTPNTRELQTALENSIRDLLVEKVKARVSKLPQEIYAQAQSKEQEENIDGAGEGYLRFLSCSQEDGSAERKHAKDFLANKFNMHPTMGASR
jgi:tetratricopeptide (TPR) repeat protein